MRSIPLILIILYRADLQDGYAALPLSRSICPCEVVDPHGIGRATGKIVTTLACGT